MTATSHSAPRSGSATRWRSRCRSTHRTTDLATSLEWSNNKGLVRFGWDGSTFDNTLDSVVWDNPLRFGPDASGAPSQGRHASWPDNTLTYLHGTGAVNIPMNGRLTAYAAFGQGRNSTDLLPHTINTAFNPPPPLSRASAEAESQMTVANFTAAMRPAAGFFLNARYRYSDVDVQTPVFDRSRGSVVLRLEPAEFEFAVGVSQRQAIVVRRRGRILRSAVHVAEGGLQQARLRLHASPLGDDERRCLQRVGRQHRQPALHAAGAVRESAADGRGFRGRCARRGRRAPTMRHFDIADRDRTRFTFIGTAAVTSSIELNASAGVGKDDYTGSQHGLVSFDSNQYRSAPISRRTIASTCRPATAGRTIHRCSVRATPATRSSRQTRNAIGRLITPAR